MQTLPCLTLAALLTTLVPATAPAFAQTAATPIGHTSARDLQVSGAVEVHGGEMQLGNGSMVTAGDQAITIALNRGGQLRLCSTTSIHLSHDRSVDAPDSTALMLALDRGAIEANYTVGKYSDVLLTPDLRVLISGPGQADLHIRVNGRGDTCVDNRGPNAPYITVTSQLEGGLYRVQPNQHVSFQHGSLREVVDTETAPCGCPAAPTVSVASAGSTSANPAPPGQPAGQPVGGPSSTPADTAFPLAVSEGLAAPPPPPTAPVVPPGEVHAQVAVPLTFNGSAPPAATAPAAPSRSATPAPSPASKPAAPATPTAPTPGAAPVRASAVPGPSAPKPSQQASAPKRFFRTLGHFFSRVFGAE